MRLTISLNHSVDIHGIAWNILGRRHPSRAHRWRRRLLAVGSPLQSVSAAWISSEHDIRFFDRPKATPVIPWLPKSLALTGPCCCRWFLWTTLAHHGNSCLRESVSSASRWSICPTLQPLFEISSILVSGGWMITPSPNSNILISFRWDSLSRFSWLSISSFRCLPSFSSVLIPQPILKQTFASAAKVENATRSNGHAQQSAYNQHTYKGRCYSTRKWIREVQCTSLRRDEVRLAIIDVPNRRCSGRWRLGEKALQAGLPLNTHHNRWWEKRLRWFQDLLYLRLSRALPWRYRPDGKR